MSQSNINDLFEELYNDFLNETTPLNDQTTTLSSNISSEVVSTQTDIPKKSNLTNTNNNTEDFSLNEDIFGNNSITESRIKSKNNEHKDYGRHIANARKELYTKGKLTIHNFSELSEEEQINSVNKKSFWIDIDAQKMKDLGYSPLGYHFVKVFKDKIPVKPSSSPLELTQNPKLNNIINNFIYVAVGNDLKNMFEKIVLNLDVYARNYPILEDVIKHTPLLTPYVGTNPNNKKLYDDYYESGYEKDYGRFGFEKYLGEMKDGFKERESKYKDQIIAALPEYKEELEKIDPLLFNQVVTINLDRKFLGGLSDSYAFLRLAKNKLLKASSWSEILKGDLSLSKNDDELVDGNVKSLIDLILKTKVQSSHNKMTALKINNLLEQQFLDNVVRNGYDFIGKTQVIDKVMDETFGIDGIQWGEWVSGANERQNLLNLSYEALSDLALGFNIDRKYISLFDGEKSLAIGFGSQGVAGSKAHYQSGQHFLHLNRKNSAGSLAHEWFHAYDYFLFKDIESKGVLPKEITDRCFNNRFLSHLIHYANNDYFGLRDIQKQTEIINTIKDYNPEIYELMTFITNDKKLNFNLKNAEKNPDYLSYLQKPENLGNPVDFIEQFTPLYKNIFSNIKEDVKNILFFLNFDLDAEDMDKNIYFKYNCSSFNNLFNKYLNEESKFKNFLIVDGKFSLSFYKEHKTEIDLEIFSSLKNIYDNVFNKENIKNNLNEFQNIISEQSLDLEMKFNEYFFNSKNEDNKSQFDLLFEGISKVLSNKHPITEERLRGFIEGGKIYRSMLKDFVKEYIVNELYPKLNDLGEHPIFGTTLINNFSSNKNAVMHSFGKKFSNIIQHKTFFKLLENEYDVILPVKTQFLQDAQKLDSLNGSSYYSQPSELFARACETVTSTKTLNTYLSKVQSDNKLALMLGLDLYPTSHELEKISILLSKAIKNTFPSNFELSLEKLPYIENQYGFNENVLNDNEKTKHIKLKS